MSTQLTKSFTSTLFGQIPAGGIAGRNELRRLLLNISGYLFVGALPERMADGVFERLVRRYRTKHNPNRDMIVERMQAILGGYCSDLDIRACVERYYEGRIEDLWGRWQASHKSKWPGRTEVMGLEHVDTALQRGSGVVFWVMCFCGSLFSKIALSRAGVAVTSLAAATHGVSDPMTLLGKWVVGPLHCLPEERYLCERIRIPVDRNRSYFNRIGEVLQNNGCVSIYGETLIAKKPVTAELLGHLGRFPVGAPVFALRHNATLLPVHTQRLGRFHYRVTVEPPISLKRSIGRKDVINQAVQDYAQRLETQILISPSDWDWDYSWVKNLITNPSQGRGRSS